MLFTVIEQFDYSFQFQFQHLVWMNSSVPTKGVVGSVSKMALKLSFVILVIE